FATIDGTKFRCPASLRANRKLASIEAELAGLTQQIETELARIVAQMLAESRRADLEDDQLPGMPPGPGRDRGPSLTCQDCRGRCMERLPAGPGWPGRSRSWTTDGPNNAPTSTPGYASGRNGSVSPARGSPVRNRHPRSGT